MVNEPPRGTPLTGQARGRATTHGELSVVREGDQRGRRRGPPPMLHPIRIAWSIDDHGNMVESNTMFCLVMGYSREQVEHHPATRLLRPDADPRDPELLAICAQMERLKRGESRVEYMRDTWIQGRNGRIEIAEAVMTRSPFQPRFEVFADVTVADINAGAQFKTPWDQQDITAWQIERLQVEIEELRARLPRTVRELAREAAQAELLEQAVNISQLNARKKKERRPRSDTGAQILWDPQDFEVKLREILAQGNVTAQKVMDETKIQHRTTLTHYLKPYARPGETPAKCIHRLEREWFPNNVLL